MLLIIGSIDQNKNFFRFLISMDLFPGCDYRYIVITANITIVPKYLYFDWLYKVRVKEIMGIHFFSQ